MRRIITEALYEVDLLGERGDIVSAEGLPYLGNKGRLFDWILRTIERDRGMTNDKVGIPFCGGGSDTIGFARNGYKVKANDLNKGIVDLLKRVTKGDRLVQLWAKQFISKDFFEELKNRDDWMGAFARSYWSFRNIGQTYVFSSKELEKAHQVLWEAVVWRDVKAIERWKAFAEKKGYEYIEEVPSVTWLRDNFGGVAMIFYGLQIDKFKVDNYKDIEWSATDYMEQDWSGCDFLYCDAPYTYKSKRDSTAYRETIGCVGGFDHKRFWAWAKEQAQERDVYVSEQYKAKDCEVLAVKERAVSLSSYNTGRKARKEYILKVKV